jgi:uncharacterized protein (TIGR02145 family)
MEKSVDTGFFLVDNDNSTDGTYGKLYNWFAIQDSMGICPVGWDVPSDPEFAVLT